VAIINNAKVLLPRAYVIVDNVDYLFRPFGFIATNIFNYWTFQSFDFERIKLEIYGFIAWNSINW